MASPQAYDWYWLVWTTPSALLVSVVEAVDRVAAPVGWSPAKAGLPAAKAAGERAPCFTSIQSCAAAVFWSSAAWSAADSDGAWL